MNKLSSSDAYTYQYWVLLAKNVKFSAADQIYTIAYSHLESLLSGSDFKLDGNSNRSTEKSADWSSPRPTPAPGAAEMQKRIILRMGPANGEFGITITLIVISIFPK